MTLYFVAYPQSTNKSIQTISPGFSNHNMPSFFSKIKQCIRRRTAPRRYDVIDEISAIRYLLRTISIHKKLKGNNASLLVIGEGFPFQKSLQDGLVSRNIHYKSISIDEIKELTIEQLNDIALIVSECSDNTHNMKIARELMANVRTRVVVLLLLPVLRSGVECLKYDLHHA